MNYIHEYPKNKICDVSISLSNVQETYFKG